MAEKRQLWDRLEDEGPKAWEAFRAYRDMGPKRATRKVPEAIGRPPGYQSVIDRWSVRYRWVERCAAWDDYQDKVAQEAIIKELEEMKRRHIQEAVGLQTKALERLRNLAPEELTAGNVLSFITEAIKIERMARGEPDQIMEERRQLTNDEARAISQLATDPEFLGALQRAVEETENGDNADGGAGSMAKE